MQILGWILIVIGWFKWLRILFWVLLATALWAEWHEKRCRHWMILLIGIAFIFVGHLFVIISEICIDPKVTPVGTSGALEIEMIPYWAMIVSGILGVIGSIFLLAGAIGWNLERWRRRKNREPDLTDCEPDELIGRVKLEE